jgi:hypothetical protein
MGRKDHVFARLAKVAKPNLTDLHRIIKEVFDAILQDKELKCD